MVIGMILDSSFPPDPRVENEAISLINEGFEVHLFCFTFSKTEKLYELISGIHVHRYYCSKATYKLSALAYTFPLYHWILKKPIRNFLNQNKIDVIHIHDIQIARSVFELKLKQRIVLDLHENRPEIMKHYAHVNSFLGKILINPETWRKYEYRYIKAADRVIVVTESARLHYTESVGVDKSKLIVVPNTIRKSFYKDYFLNTGVLRKYKDTFNLLYLGDTGTRRGTLDLIRAVKLVKGKIPKLKLIIVGKSKEDPMLEAEIENLNLEGVVDLSGWQNFKNFQSYLEIADIGFSPLHRNLHHDTTYANKIFQYMSFGVPVIASDSVAQKKVIQDAECGIVHKAEDEESIATSILKLYNDKKLRSELGSNGQQVVEQKYHWKSTSKSLIELYKSWNS